MLSDEEAHQRWTSSLMNLHSSSPASAAGSSHIYQHVATYQPPMTAYTDCSRPITDLTSATAGFSGYRYVAGRAGYNTDNAGRLHASSERFRLPHDLWAESTSGAGKLYCCLTLCITCSANSLMNSDNISSIFY